MCSDITIKLMVGLEQVYIFGNAFLQAYFKNTVY